MLSLPASREAIADQGLLPTRSWWRYFQELFGLLGGNGAIQAGQVQAASLVVTADNSLIFSSQTSDAGTATGTLGNSPRAGNPAFWLRIQVNGQSYAVPLWLA